MFKWMLPVFQRSRASANTRVDKVETGMGTVITLIAYGVNASGGTDAVTAELRRLEAQFSVFLPESDISRLNTGAGMGPVPVSPETIRVLAEAKRYSDLSGGAFDCTVGPLVRVWRDALAEGRRPTGEAIREAAGLVGYRALTLDAAAGTAALARAGQSLDLGGVAKGYAADRAIEVFRAAGVRAALVNLGGNVVVTGPRPDGSPWQAGVRDPRREGAPVGVLSLPDGAAVTSGDYERFTMVDGQRCHHLLDPRSGEPALSGLAGVTVVAATGLAAGAAIARRR